MAAGPVSDAPYAEDHALAVMMLRAGFAKVFEPRAGVLHSHHYTPIQQLQRTFDDWRGLLEVYGWREPLNLRHVVLQMRGAAGTALREARCAGVGRSREPVSVLAAVFEQILLLTGAVLGSRADRLPAWARRILSLERRDSFHPLIRPSRPPAAPDVRASDRRAPDVRPQTPSAFAADDNASR